MKKTLLFCCLLLPMLMAVKCEDDLPREPTLPPETRTGEHTFGCLINGEVFLPKGMPFTSVGIQAFYVNGGFSLVAKYQNLQRIVIQGDNIDSTGVYSLNDQTAQYAYYLDDHIDTCYGFNVRSQTGTLEITRLDIQKRIISGRFNFTITQNGCPDIMATEGRFDVEY